MNKKYFLGVAALLCMQATQSSAQLKETLLDTVTVNSRKKISQERKEFQRHGQSTEVLSEYDLNRNNPAFIEQSLSTMAGVQVDKRTQLGGQRIVVRGYGNDQKFNNWGIKAYLNGVPLTTADGVTVLDDVDFSLVNAIEVVKGPAATMYGGGVGGAVRFYMRPETKEGVTISQKTAVGSFGLFQSGTRVDAVGKNYSVMLNYGHLQSNGYRPNGQSLKNNYAVLSNFKLNAKQDLSVYVSHNFSDEGVSGQIPYAQYYAGVDSGNAAYIRKGAGNDFKNTRAYITHNWKILENFSNNTSIFFSLLDAKRVAAGAYETSMNPSYGIRSSFNLKNNLNTAISNSLDFGIEHTISRSLVSNYRFTGSITTPLEVSSISKGSFLKYNNSQSSVFVIDRLTYKPLDASLLIGVSGNFGYYNRTDLLALPGLLSDYNKDVSFNKNFSTVFTPHIALQKTINKQIINLSYSEGYNVPTAATTFISGINKTNDSLQAERAKMVDLSIQGLLFKSKFDYQISLFAINVANKLTQLSSTDASNTKYSYWANTGNQLNRGIEVSVGYNDKFKGFIKSIEPFISYSYYKFKYTDFKTILGGTYTDFSEKQVVGVPVHKAAIGLDVDTKTGLYVRTTYNYLGDVYTDFANTNLVKGYYLLNSKIGYKTSYKKWELEAYVAGNNLTNQINYTFLFLGNNINDSDANSGYGSAKTDLNPGAFKAYFFGGINLKFKIN